MRPKQANPTNIYKAILKFLHGHLRSGVLLFLLAFQGQKEWKPTTSDEIIFL